MRRRAFLGCGALAALAAVRRADALATPGGEARPGTRARLVWEDRRPLRAGDLAPHRDYLFFYPFEGTPCFLLDLGRPVPGGRIPLSAGGDYAWPGGVGPGRSIVAYTAICPHTYTHPTRDSAMIHYFGPDQPATVAQRGGVITCCVHGSAFDPAQGGVPLQPPAELPLATVLLDWDAGSGALHATGIAGRPVFTEFFGNFPVSARHAVGDITPVWELARYSRALLPC